jgi:hypothetical protein
MSQRMNYNPASPTGMKALGAVLIVGGGLALSVGQSQQSGVKRTDLLRHDLSVSARGRSKCASRPLPTFFVSRRERQTARRIWSGERLGEVTGAYRVSAPRGHERRLS